MKPTDIQPGSYGYLDIVKYAIKYTLFWFLVFAAGRLVFIGYFWKHISAAPITDVLQSFVYGLKLDISATCYILIVPWAVLFLQSLIGWRIWDNIKLYYTAIILFVYSCVIFSELPIYEEWDTKLNYKALHYMLHPNEVLDNAGWKRLVFGVLAIVVFTWIGVWAYKKYVHKPFIRLTREWGFTMDWLNIPILLLIGIRGGFQQVPIQTSAVYFSSNNDVNTAAVNSLWNIGASIQLNYIVQFHNAYTFMDMKVARERVKQLNAVPKDTTISILTTKRPNIVFVILESWSAQCIHSFGGDSVVTPQIDALTNDGVSFTQCYASGERSEQGMAAILSAFPSQPLTAIINQPDKYQKLPCLLTPFKQQGYSSLFLFGGELAYGNIKGYIYYNHFDRILEGKDFANKYPSGRLGIADQFMFDEYVKQISKQKEPFFTGMFTLSSHNPFDMPWKPKFKWGGDDMTYVNSMYYADSCIGDFIRKAKKEPWYKNTLFVFVSDHSHNTPFCVDDKDALHHWILCMLYGEVIKPEYRGTKIKDVFSQTDIAATVLAQAGLPYKDFVWSKNYFNPYSKRFSYSGIEDGFIWCNAFTRVSYDKDRKIIREKISDVSKRDSALTDGKAYLETLFQQYLDY